MSDRSSAPAPARRLRVDGRGLVVCTCGAAIMSAGEAATFLALRCRGCGLRWHREIASSEERKDSEGLENSSRTVLTL